MTGTELEICLGDYIAVDNEQYPGSWLVIGSDSTGYQLLKGDVRLHCRFEKVIRLPVPRGGSCDRCGAASVLSVVTPSGDLQFCGHHGRRFAGSFEGYVGSLAVSGGYRVLSTVEEWLTVRSG